MSCKTLDQIILNWLQWYADIYLYLMLWHNIDVSCGLINNTTRIMQGYFWFRVVSLRKALLPRWPKHYNMQGLVLLYHPLWLCMIYILGLNYLIVQVEAFQFLTSRLMLWDPFFFFFSFFFFVFDLLFPLLWCSSV